MKKPFFLSFVERNGIRFLRKLEVSAGLDEVMPYFMAASMAVVRGGERMKIGERIRRARRRAGMSQVQLAAAINVRRSAVSNWESTSDIHPTMAHLVSIAHACNVSLDWLGTGRGEYSGDELDQVQVADAELIDAPNERGLLANFRSLPRHSQILVLDLLESLVTSRRARGARKKSDFPA